MISTCCHHCAHRRGECLASQQHKPMSACEYLKGGKCKLPKDGKCYVCEAFEKRGKK